ncbi:universal stress protein [Nonomuraea sp. NPDC048916]|uniref:universal stress protein n=1 Tax=Nonomuraea sp. NPDC048916 TaxID=3154232 RepID=UPI0033E8B1C6
MNDATGTPRIVVGMNDSQGARWALAWAIGEARLRRMPLFVVHALDIAARTGRRAGSRGPSTMAEAGALLAAIVDEVADGPPEGIETRAGVSLGAPGPVLVRTARENDLLVIGRGSRAFHTSGVARHCQRHARATVVSVARPCTADLAGPGAGQGHRFWDVLLGWSRSALG